MKPSKREFKKVLFFLSEAKEKISELGWFPSYWEEGQIDIHYNVSVAMETIRNEMRNKPIYLPLVYLFGIEQDWLEEREMWILHSIRN